MAGETLRSASWKNTREDIGATNGLTAFLPAPERSTIQMRSDAE
jgi:hypothetical protein